MQTTQKTRYFLELGEDGEDEGEHAEQRGGEAELRALAQSHGAGPGRSIPCSIGVPEDGNGTGSRLAQARAPYYDLRRTYCFLSWIRFADD